MFGAEIRKAREIQGRTLDDLAVATRIHRDTLHHIEEEALDRLPPSVYTRGYLVLLGRELGLDEPTMGSILEDFVGKSGHLPPQKRILKREAEGNGNPNPLPFLAMAALLLAALGGAWLFWPEIKTTIPLNKPRVSTPRPLPPRPPVIQPAVSPSPAANPLPQPENEPALPEPLPAPETTAETEAGEAGTEAEMGGPPTDEALINETLSLEIKALSPSWLQWKSDGGSTYDVTLAAGERKTLEADQTLWIKAGNSGGLQLILNGHKLPPLGAIGQVRTVLYNRETLSQFSP